MKSAPRVIVITGAAGGLGRALCLQLKLSGETLIALDHDIEAINRLTEELQYSQLFTYLLDVCSAHEITNTFTAIERQHQCIDVLINNAGITQIGSVDSISPSTLDQVMNINFRGAALVAIAATPLLRTSKGSHVAISSVAGFSPLLKRSIYCASKHALAGFYATLRAEEREHGVHVLLVSPAFIATNVGAANSQDNIQRPGSASDSLDHMSPEHAAATIVQALNKRQETLYLGRVAKISQLLQRLSPRAYEFMMRRTMQKQSGGL